MQLTRLLISFVILSILFALIEVRWPAVARERKAPFRAGFAVDFAYWLFNPLVTKAVVTFCSGLVVLTVMRIGGVGLETLKATGFGPVSRQPMWLIVPEMLLLGDLVGYWVHRAFHSIDDLWDLHSIHHSSKELDWLSSVRVHPLNEILSKTIRVVPLAALGFPLTALAGYLPFLILLAILVHANVPWDFGRLRYVIASPLFHRWHHALDQARPGCNFAGLFPFIDAAFGTLCLPKRQPRVFGVGAEIPSGFAAQLLYPFRIGKYRGREPVSRTAHG